MESKCGHCHKEIPLTGGHECTPECLHCGKTFGDLENPKYDSPKVAVSRHQRECDGRPTSWDEPINDPEARFRKKRREEKRIMRWEERHKRRHIH